MARPPRIEYENALYHVTSRGNGRTTIFYTDDDRQRFLEQLRDNLETYDVVLYAFVLMANHYHLLIRTRRANLSRFMQRLNTSYGLYCRYKNKKPGHVFQGRYKALVVEGDKYRLALTRYIHLNPIKIKQMEDRPATEKKTYLRDYRWSSYPGYIGKKLTQDWISYDTLTKYGRNRSEGRRRYRAYVEAFITGDDEELHKALREARLGIGNEEWVKQLERQLVVRRSRGATDKDVGWPEGKMGLDEIAVVVAKEYGQTRETLKRHGHVAGVAKRVALELACRLSGETQRAIGAYFGGISSQAVGMMRKKARMAGKEEQELISRLLLKLTK